MANVAQLLTAALIPAKAPVEMIDRARNGYYSGHTSPLTMPVTQLISDCLRAGLPSIADRARAGDFTGQ
jgi:hypothetical protein